MLGVKIGYIDLAEVFWWRVDNDFAVVHIGCVEGFVVNLNQLSGVVTFRIVETVRHAPTPRAAARVFNLKTSC